MAKLQGKKVAIIVDNFFEEAEFTGPLSDLKRAGAQVDVIAPQKDRLQSMKHADKADTYVPDRTIDEIDPDNYDALVLPGGAVNADNLRMNDKVKQWVGNFLQSGKPVAAICHAPWVLASAGLATGRRLTSYFTIQDDMRNAGADWVDEEVVIDHNLITSRQPADVPAFDKAIIQMMAAG